MGNPIRQSYIYHRLAIIALIFFAFAMSALVSERVFERLPHLEDEVAYVFQARVFAGGQVTVDSPEPRRAFWQPFVLDDTTTGQRFGKYTPGWPLVLSAGVAAGQAWLVNALFAALSVALVFRLGSEIFNPDVGLIAALLVAFSPMALLLNASLMGHTTALFFTTCFIFAYWRLQQQQHALLWGILAGVMLGLLVISRPLSGVAVALPFVAWSGLRLLKSILTGEDFSQRLANTGQTLLPLIALGGITLFIMGAIPLFNHAATGDSSQNLYERVWEYDRIGFGECCGRNGHRIEKAYIHGRYDLSLTAADLFGWQIGEITDEIEYFWLNESVYYPNLGLSFVLIPFGVVAGVLWGVKSRRDMMLRLALLIVWTIGTVFWLILPLKLDLETIRDPGFSWFWVIMAAVWLLAPLGLLVWHSRLRTVQYAWLLLAVMLSVLLMQATYWIGSQRYSTRYYFEGLTAAALITALPLAALARMTLPAIFLSEKRKAAKETLRSFVYPALLALSVISLYTYSMPRVSVLNGFNFIDREKIEAIEARRDGDKPVLVLITGPGTGDDRVRWRAHGALMTQTWPLLDSDIVAAWDYGGVREQILAQFPDHQVIEMQAQGNDAWFVDE